MELTLTKRQAGKKSETNKIRREGNILAVLYSKGKKGEDVVVDGNAFKKILNKIESGTLSSKVFTLQVDGKPIQAIIKDIQYHVTTYEPLHIDFAELHEGSPVTLNIPVKLTGVVECAGVKLGGVLRQVIRHVQVRCLPKDIPDHFSLDVRHLLTGQSVRLNKISIPSAVRPVINLNEVAAVVGKR
ncbi:MAG: 50S ribosomal protein L25 [Chlamydiales bacterium]|nr:50S ribosomal protein L25 [Chlamydiales bacterium]